MSPALRVERVPVYPDLGLERLPVRFMAKDRRWRCLPASPPTVGHGGGISGYRCSGDDARDVSALRKIEGNSAWPRGCSFQRHPRAEVQFECRLRVDLTPSPAGIRMAGIGRKPDVSGSRCEPPGRAATCPWHPGSHRPLSDPSTDLQVRFNSDPLLRMPASCERGISPAGGERAIAVSDSSGKTGTSGEIIGSTRRLRGVLTSGPPPRRITARMRLLFSTEQDFPRTCSHSRDGNRLGYLS
jgi:hypothetical protein